MKLFGAILFFMTFSVFAHLCLSDTHAYTHVHIPPHTHTNAHTFTLSFTHFLPLCSLFQSCHPGIMGRTYPRHIDCQFPFMKLDYPKAQVRVCECILECACVCVCMHVREHACSSVCMYLHNRLPQKNKR